jgi:hypothetical protein
VTPLAATVARVQDQLEGTRALEDGLALLEAAEQDPRSDTAAADFARRLQGQQKVLVAYANLQKAYDDLSAADKERFASLAPAKLYVREGGRDYDATVAVLVRFALAARAIAQRRPPEPEPADQIDLLGLRAALRQVVPDLAMPAPVKVDAPPAPAAPKPPAPPPQPVRRDALGSLKWWGTLIALLTAILGAVAFLLPKYASHTYGSWQDYLWLACYGFLGSLVTGGLVLNWDLFPSQQSTRVATPTGQQT